MIGPHTLEQRADQSSAEFGMRHGRVGKRRAKLRVDVSDPRTSARSVAHRMRPARAAGYSHTRIIFRHMAPNVVAPYLIMLTAFVAQAILAETSLSFLGLGIQEPTAAWG